MVERYLFVRLASEHAVPSVREELRARALELGTIPGVRAVTVGRPADAGSQAAWDLSLAVRLDDLSSVAAYLAHPTHEGFLNRWLAPRAAVIKAWSFEI